MKELIIYLLKSGLWITLFLAIYWFFLRKSTFFRFNRFFLLLGLLLSFLLPLYQFRYQVDMILPVNNINIPVIQVNLQSSASFFNWPVFLFAVYFFGVCVLAVFYLIGLKKIKTLINSNPAFSEGRFKLIDSQAFDAPFSAFNYIFMNSEKISTIEKKLILDHEQAHVEQYHWIDLVLAKIVCIVQWFNPFVWIYIHFIKQNHEYQADEVVLRKGNSQAVYQAVLINYSLNISTYPFSNSFAYTSNNLKRFNMMKTPVSNPARKWATALLLPLSGIFFWAFAEPEYVIREPEVRIDTNYLLDVATNDSIAAVGYNTIQDIEKDTVTIVRYGKMKDVAVAIQNPDKQGNIVVTGYRNSDTISTKKVTVHLGNDSVKTVGNVTVAVQSNEGVPRVVVDGKEVESINNIKPEDIESVTVIKDKMLGNNGVVLITTKKSPSQAASLKEASSDSKVIIRSPFQSNGENIPLYIVDGKEVSTLNEIRPEDIDNMSVLKDKSAADIYGDKGKNGVIIITTKKK